MKHLPLKIISAAALSLGTVLPAAAQVPAHGSVPNTPAASYIQQGSTYSTSNPNANFIYGVQLNDAQGFPPFQQQFLEISAPNTAPMTINMLTSTACTQTSPRGFECQIQYPLSTADMTGPSANITTRYYVSKNSGSYQGYHRKFETMNGTAGSTGTASGGGGNTIPPMTTIPPHTTITGDTNYLVDVIPNVQNFNPTTNVLPISLEFMPNSPPTSISLPFANELVEVKSPNGAVKSVNIAAECTRLGMILECETTYVLQPADMALQVLPIEARYYANDYYNNTQILWTGYSRGEGIMNNTTVGSGSGFNGTNCPPETAPMMPTNTNSNVNGSVFTFTQNPADVCDDTFWIDPPIAIGYSYAVSGGEFESVTLPSLQTVADNNGYTLHYNSGGAQSVAVMPGQQFIFPSPVSGYQIKGIDMSLALGLHDPAAFAMGVKLTNPTGAQVKITQIPMPASTGVVLDRPIHERFERVRPMTGVGVATQIKPSVAKPVRVAPGKIAPKAVEPEKVDPEKLDSEKVEPTPRRKRFQQRR